MIQAIAASQAFRMDSIHPLDELTEQPDGDIEQQRERLQAVRDTWGVFPLVRLRPEQVIDSMLQANNIRTIDQNSHLFVRALRFFREQGFVNEFGDPGEGELEPRVATIPQALLRMNGQLSRELTEAGPFRKAADEA
jgi:hypothetical protein